MAGAMALLLLVYASWQVFRWPPIDRTFVGDAFFYPVGIAATFAALGAARRARHQPRIRAAWYLLAAGASLYLGGDIAQTIYEAQGSLPFPSVSDALYLSFYPVMLAGLLCFPTRRGGHRAVRRLILDLTVVALGGAMLVTFVVLGPTVREGWQGMLSTIVSVSYPVGDMILLVGLGSALLRRTDPSSAPALRFMAAALASFVAADMVYGYILLHSTYHGGDPVDSLWMIAIALTAVAGAAQTTPTRTPHTVEEETSPQASWAPYLASALGFGLLIIDHHDLVMTLAAVALASLVAARQFLAQRDLVRHQRLARHHSLHDALTGLTNRRGLIADLQAALSPPRAPRALAAFDLDGFKAYNDTFGHLAGDLLLARLGQRLADAVGPFGRAYRLGGDEFCVLLDPGVLAPDAIFAAADAALSEDGPGFSIGASYGTVVIPAEAAEVSATLDLADTRMYAHKSSRRAGTIVAQTRDVLLRAAAEHTASLPEHMLEVGELARRVALRLGLDAETVELTLRAGELHDVGKLAIPESIVNKPARLNDEEWALMRRHTLVGERMLDAAPALRPVAAIVRSAHERFDGGGYPDGLAGEQIPLPARIVFACDAYHAMIDTRPYAPSAGAAAARDELRRCAGTQFDPIVIDALVAELEQGRATVSDTSPPTAERVGLLDALSGAGQG
jgi:diguanylate cyclase (GGDEF)-like protein